MSLHLTLMSDIATRAKYSSALAPIILIGGWTIAEASWSAYDPMRQTISELAASDAPTKVFMTAVFVLTGLCHIISASGLRNAAMPGRIALGIGGVAIIAVAFTPLPSVAQHSAAHTTVATISFTAMSIWPLLAMRNELTAPWMLSKKGSWFGTLFLGALALIFLATWLTESSYAGFTERMISGSQVFWPWGLVRDTRKSAKQTS